MTVTITMTRKGMLGPISKGNQARIILWFPDLVMVTVMVMVINR